VLPGEEVVPKLGVLVHVLVAHQVGELVDAAAYLCIQLRPRLERRGDRHHGTVEVPTVGEGDVGVVDALVALPKRIALLFQHVPTVMLGPGARDDAR
jgi:hypothetical protein